ncbi:putative B3 domain-containing protein Os03g0621600 [Aristolochia californica]|uniref:putative B3 domain-containing protein Os03g0621600 n=1 Tax=Aristolochia californica TaxID=171875 RepID=UPI0035D8E4C4
MKEKCEDCKWREHFYWNRLDAWYFHTVLGSGFSQRLIIPRKFAKHLRKKLPDHVFLMGPSRIPWPVGLTRASGQVFFNNGWEKFVEENCLAQGDALVFHYKGVSSFEVLVFEKKTGCEKLASLFAKQRNCRSETRGGINSSNVESLPCNGTCTRKEPASHSAQQAEEVTDHHLVTEQPKQQHGRFGSKEKTKHAGSCSHRGKSPRSSPQMSPDIENLNTSLPTRKHNNHRTAEYLLKRYPFFFQSNRRAVTEEEKVRVLELARAARMKNPSFLVVMVPCHVTYKFFLAIPVAFVRSDLRRVSGGTIILCNPSGKEWSVNYVAGRTVSGLCGGWDKFVWDNNLEEGDALVFESNHQRRLFHVHIFRVVKQTVPLVLVRRDESRRLGMAKKGGPSCRLRKSSFLHRRRIGNGIRPANGKSCEGSSKKKTTRGGCSSAASENPSESETEEEDETNGQDYRPYPFFFKSNRRPVTCEEEERAIELAGAVQPANPYFQSIMQRSHVTVRFYATVPASFIRENADIFCNKDQEVMLRSPSGTTNVVWYKRRTITGGGFDKGWADFVLDNNLEQGDVLIFELCTGGKKTTFSVQIFRVVEEVVPLTKTWRREIAHKRQKITRERMTKKARAVERIDDLFILMIVPAEFLLTAETSPVPEYYFHVSFCFCLPLRTTCPLRLTLSSLVFSSAIPLRHLIRKLPTLCKLVSERRTHTEFLDSPSAEISFCNALSLAQLARMEGKCDECKWKEHFYWNHLDSWYFSSTLGSDFSQHLECPEKFAKHLKGKVPEYVVLTGPSSNAWPVRLRWVSGKLFFEIGWSTFAEDHSLVEGDTVMFSYTGHCQFNVLMFEKSGCEKLAPFFLKTHQGRFETRTWRTDPTPGSFFCTCNHSSMEAADHNSQQPSEEDHNGSVSGQARGRKERKPGRGRRDQVPWGIDRLRKRKHVEGPSHSRKKSSPPGGQNIRLPRDVEEDPVERRRTVNGEPSAPAHEPRRGCTLPPPQPPNLGPSPSCSPPVRRGRGRPPLNSKTTEPPGRKMKTARGFSSSGHQNESSGEEESTHENYSQDITRYPLYFKSNRRPVTAEEKQRAIKLAQAVKPSNPHFISIMKKSHVTVKFFLTIPVTFTRKNSERFRNGDQQVLLHDPSGKVYPVTLRLTKYIGGVSIGWSEFVLGNNLEKGDVLLFELIKGRRNATFKVQIFRVVNQVVPLTKIHKQETAPKHQRMTRAREENKTRLESDSGLITPKDEEEEE